MDFPNNFRAANDKKVVILEFFNLSSHEFNSDILLTTWIKIVNMNTIKGGGSTNSFFGTTENLNSVV